MSFTQYADTPPDEVGQLDIRLQIRRAFDETGNNPTMVKSGDYRFTLIDTATNTQIEVRQGDLQNATAQINGTSITVPMLLAWLDELLELARGTLPVV